MKIISTLLLLGSFLILNTLAAPIIESTDLPVENNDSKRATGKFMYSYNGEGGQEVKASLSNPEMEKCINIPELEHDDDDDDDDGRAFNPYNRLRKTAAVVFIGSNCRGTPFYILPGEPKWPVPFYFASVRFESSM